MAVTAVCSFPVVDPFQGRMSCDGLLECLLKQGYEERPEKHTANQRRGTSQLRVVLNPCQRPHTHKNGVKIPPRHRHPVPAMSWLSRLAPEYHGQTFFGSGLRPARIVLIGQERSKKPNRVSQGRYLGYWLGAHPAGPVGRWRFTRDQSAMGSLSCRKTLLSVVCSYRAASLRGVKKGARW